MMTQHQDAASTRSPRSTTFLDGVRGIASLLVYLHHFAPPFFFYEHHKGFGQLDPTTGQRTYHFTGLPIIRLLYTGGDAAVAIFFVLSGFVLTVAPIRKIVSQGNVEHRSSPGTSRLALHKRIFSAALRRPIRLYLPALAVAITYAALRHTPIIPVQTYPIMQPDVLQEIVVCVKEFVVFFNPFKQHGINMEWFLYGTVMWTLPIELKGSMLVFAALIVFEFMSRSPIQMGGFVMALDVLWSILLLFNQWTMALFLVGMRLAIRDVVHQDTMNLPRIGAVSKKVANRLDHIALIVGLYLLTQPSHKTSIDYSRYTPGWEWLTALTPSSYLTASGEVAWYDPEYYRFWTSIGAVLTLSSLLRIEWLQRFFAARIPIYLGKISFMLYLTHPIVGAVANVFFMRLVGQWADMNDPMGARWYDEKLWLPEWGLLGLSVRYIGDVIIQLPLALVVAHVFTKLYDEPSVKIAHKIVGLLRIGSEGGAPRSQKQDARSVQPTERLMSEMESLRRLA